MNLIFLGEESSQKNKVLLSKTGNIRIKNDFAIENNLQKSDRWVVAIDKDEAPTKHIYIFKVHESMHLKGKKMLIINGGWTLNCKLIIEELKLKHSIKCGCDKFSDDQYEGFKIILP